MQILLTNDDGIFAPGLAAIYKELVKMGDVTVVAPDVSRSGASHSITYSRPLVCNKVNADEPWVVFKGKRGPGKGKHIVFVIGDDEYRSEDLMPMLAKIMAVHHGFKCTALFSLDKETGEIDPGAQENIPGLEALKTADLMVIFTRFREPLRFIKNRTAILIILSSYALKVSLLAFLSIVRIKS